MRRTGFGIRWLREAQELCRELSDFGRTGRVGSVHRLKRRLRVAGGASAATSEADSAHAAGD